MEEIDGLEQQIRTAFPEAELRRDDPLRDSGVWHLDISYKGKELIVQWQEGKGFGISDGPGTFGEGPDEVVQSPAETLDRIMKLLNSP